MKKILYISFLILSPIILLGQEKSSDLKEQTRSSKFPLEEVQDRQAGLKKTGDEVSAPSDSSTEVISRKRMQKMRKRMMDNFMDKDGDGINDCRAKGMQWSEKGKHKGYGKHHK